MLSRAVCFLETGIQLLGDSVRRLPRQVRRAGNAHPSAGPKSESVPFSQAMDAAKETTASLMEPCMSRECRTHPAMLSWNQGPPDQWAPCSGDAGSDPNHPVPEMLCLVNTSDPGKKIIEE